MAHAFFAFVFFVLVATGSPVPSSPGHARYRQLPRFLNTTNIPSSLETTPSEVSRVSTSDASQTQVSLVFAASGPPAITALVPVEASTIVSSVAPITFINTAGDAVFTESPRLSAETTYVAQTSPTSTPVAVSLPLTFNPALSSLIASAVAPSSSPSVLQLSPTSDLSAARPTTRAAKSSALSLALSPSTLVLPRTTAHASSLALTTIRQSAATPTTQAAVSSKALNSSKQSAPAQPETSQGLIISSIMGSSQQAGLANPSTAPNLFVGIPSVQYTTPAVPSSFFGPASNSPTSHHSRSTIVKTIVVPHSSATPSSAATFQAEPTTQYASAISSLPSPDSQSSLYVSLASSNAATPIQVVLPTSYATLHGHSGATPSTEAAVPITTQASSVASTAQSDLSSVQPTPVAPASTADNPFTGYAFQPPTTDQSTQAVPSAASSETPRYRLVPSSPAVPSSAPDAPQPTAIPSRARSTITKTITLANATPATPSPASPTPVAALTGLPASYTNRASLISDAAASSLTLLASAGVGGVNIVPVNLNSGVSYIYVTVTETVARETVTQVVTTTVR